MTLRLAVFYASVGTGHKAAAEALAEACEARFPGSEVLLRDVLAYVPRSVRWSVTSSYLSMARGFPLLWEWLYRNTDRARRGFSFWNDLHRMVSKMRLKHLFKDLDDFNPDVVLATHFFGMSALLDKWEHRTPIYFVETDYVSHAMQRDPRFDGWFVGSPVSAGQHRADGLPVPELTIMDCGIPIARIYEKPPRHADARRRLEVEKGQTLVSVIGGGIGAGPIGVVAESLIDFADWRVDIVCGNNRKLYERMRDKFYPFKHISIKGFVDNMPDYYAASDIVAIKPGGLSIAEATASGAAILVLDPLPGQERGNADYLLEQGAGRMLYEPRRTGERIAELLGAKEEIERMRERARAMGRPGAAGCVVDCVAEKLAERARKAEQAEVRMEGREEEEPDDRAGNVEAEP